VFEGVGVGSVEFDEERGGGVGEDVVVLRVGFSCEGEEGAVHEFAGGGCELEEMGHGAGHVGERGEVELEEHFAGWQVDEVEGGLRYEGEGAFGAGE